MKPLSRRSKCHLVLTCRLLMPFLDVANAIVLVLQLFAAGLMIAVYAKRNKKWGCSDLAIWLAILCTLGSAGITGLLIWMAP